jgi:hypothetical protein
MLVVKLVRFPSLMERGSWALLGNDAIGAPGYDKKEFNMIRPFLQFAEEIYTYRFTLRDAKSRIQTFQRQIALSTTSIISAYDWTAHSLHEIANQNARQGMIGRYNEAPFAQI